MRSFSSQGAFGSRAAAFAGASSFNSISSAMGYQRGKSRRVPADRAEIANNRILPFVLIGTRARIASSLISVRNRCHGRSAVRAKTDCRCGRRRCRIFPPHSSGRGWYARSPPGIAIGPPKAPMPARHVLRRSTKAPVTWNARSQARGKAASRDDLRKLAKLIPMPSPHSA